jgi:hypothetical protein
MSNGSSDTGREHVAPRGARRHRRLRRALRARHVEVPSARARRLGRRRRYEARGGALVGRYDTVGIDLVAMLVDDLACVGAEPLFLLDYVASANSIRHAGGAGLAASPQGCRLAGTALLGGETAEHGGRHGADELDVAGFAVGVVERGEELGPIACATATCWSASPRRGCARTATRWPARCSSATRPR